MSTKAEETPGGKTNTINERTYQEVEYLKKNLGPILVAALAEICIRRPADPIEYLGHWLLRWRYNEELKRRDVQNALDVVRQRQWAQVQDEAAAAAGVKPDKYADGFVPDHPYGPPGYGGPLSKEDLGENQQEVEETEFHPEEEEGEGPPAYGPSHLDMNTFPSVIQSNVGDIEQPPPEESIRNLSKLSMKSERKLSKGLEEQKSFDKGPSENAIRRTSQEVAPSERKFSQGSRYAESVAERKLSQGPPAESVTERKLSQGPAESVIERKLSQGTRAGSVTERKLSQGTRAGSVTERKLSQEPAPQASSQSPGGGQYQERKHSEGQASTMDPAQDEASIRRVSENKRPSVESSAPRKFSTDDPQ